MAKRRILDLESTGDGHLMDTQFKGRHAQFSGGFHLDTVLGINDPEEWMAPFQAMERSESGDKLAEEFSKRHMLLRVTSAVRDALRRRQD